MDNLLPEFEHYKRTIPEFIIKLYHILENQNFNEIISWTSQGNEILIKSPKKLQDKVLPHFFRHKHLSSFVRQLNMYGFSKANKVMKEKNHTYFRNELFKKNSIQLLVKIKRKNNKRKGESNLEDNQNSSQNSQTFHHLSEDTRSISSFKKSVEKSVTFIQSQIKSALALIQSYANQNKKQRSKRKQSLQQQTKTKSESFEQHTQIKEKLLKVLQQCQQIKQVKKSLTAVKTTNKNQLIPQSKIQNQLDSFPIEDMHCSIPYQQPLFSIKSLKDCFASINCFASQYNIIDKVEPNNNNNGFQYE